MSYLHQMQRWLPLVTLTVLALVYEPVRSGFTFSDQQCDLTANSGNVQSAFFNLRHIISYGLLCLVAAAAFRQYRLLTVAAGVFLFSVFLEIEQSFFSTGHCRLRDLIPNLVGIGAVIIIIHMTVVLRR